MTVKIPRSMIPDPHAFDAAVANLAHEMRHWRAHMKRVEEDEKNNVQGIERHHPIPRPVAHQLVAQCVDENDNASYEIVDDGPTPEQRLAQRKIELVNAVRLAEQAAADALVPPARRRLFNLREAEVSEQDRRTMDEIMAGKGKGIFAKFKKNPDPEEVIAAVHAKRDAKQAQFMAEQAERRRRMAAIERAAAEAEDAVEDLTLDTIDAFKVPDFSAI
jgi:hypothetical protein